MTGVALSTAQFLGKSRAISVFAGLVAVAGLVNEIQRRRGSNAGDEG
ncbi:MAG TPA: hypothetical protein VGP56_08825 [Gaiellaceae bacterium]|jgi:hypothetical protein|nr:hypothetical protein [Gaiellaceae bacterium]